MPPRAAANHFFAADFPVCYIQGREEPEMSLAEKIQKDLVDAMRAKEELRLSVLRGIKAAIKHREVEKMGAVVTAAKSTLEGKTVDGKVLSDRVRDRLSKLA